MDNFVENLKLYLNKSFLGETSSQSQITIGELASLIKDEPTAYDIDKVVEEIRKAKDEDNMVCYINNKQVIEKMQAIEIVKQGVVADDVCEWKQTSTARYKTSCGYRLEEHFDTKACFCKQCGKKIKVVG